MRRDARRLRRPFAALSILVLAACADSTAPTPESVVGSYEATMFTMRTAEADRDILAEGGYLRLTLHQDKTVEGELFVPGGADGAAVIADIVGQWVLLESEVRFNVLPDTFVRDLPFIVDGRRLVGEGTVDGVDYLVVMERSQPL
ncbi:MAG TPA: hypothetical protein VF158_14225 [Longimicrobiales bacterium]